MVYTCPLILLYPICRMPLWHQVAHASAIQSGIIFLCRLEILEPAPSVSQHKAPIGDIWAFSYDQSNRDLSGAYVLWSERKDKHAWNATRHPKIMDSFCLHLFPHVRLAWAWIPSIGACSHRYRKEIPELLWHAWRCQPWLILVPLDKCLTSQTLKGELHPDQNEHVLCCISKLSASFWKIMDTSYSKLSKELIGI